MDSPPNPVDPFGLLEPEARLDPYPAYARLRRQAPVYFSEEWDGWLLTRYQNVLAGFRDRRFSANRVAAYAAKLPPPARDKLAPLLNNFSAWAFFLDPPAHTRLRSLLNKAFAPRLIEGIRPRVQAIVDRLLSARAQDGHMDVVGDLASPLPMLVIATILGVPEEDHHRLKGWSDTLAAFMGGRRMSLEICAQALDGVLEMEEYFRRILTERRRVPREDLLTSLLHAEDEGRILSEQELLSTCTMVLFGGHETTINQIGTSVLALLRNPAELDALRCAPELVPNAVEELLRYDSPTQRMGRIAACDLMIGEQHIREGDRVWLVLGAANRDPEQFPNPDRLDLRRADVRHLSFGNGTHYCVGAALARLEAQIAIGTLVSRFTALSIATDEPIAWLDNLTVRGPQALPVRLTGVR